MATRALAIRNAILTTLRASAVAGIPADRIYADLRDAIHTRPSIVVDMGDEDAPAKVYSNRNRTVALTLRILAEGADPCAMASTRAPAAATAPTWRSRLPAW